MSQITIKIHNSKVKRNLVSFLIPQDPQCLSSLSLQFNSKATTQKNLSIIRFLKQVIYIFMEIIS